MTYVMSLPSYCAAYNFGVLVKNDWCICYLRHYCMLSMLIIRFFDRPLYQCTVCSPENY